MNYDSFQKKAFQYIHQGHSVIVAAPTGAGKTVIAERVIETCLQKGEKVIYTSPIKALSNQKYRDFKDNYAQHVGILTGDVTINAQASALIMTTEIFRNKILEERSNLRDYSWVIFDEIHYLDDYERGTVWEESLIFLPRHMNLLGLSATIPNIDDMVKWLSKIHQRSIKVVKQQKRPVPLQVYFQCQGKVYDNFNEAIKEGFYSPEVNLYKDKRIPKKVHLKPNSPVSLIKTLQRQDRLPCVYFVFSRRRTEYLAEEMRSFDFLSAEQKREIGILYEELCERFDLTHDAGAEKLRPFIQRGIAYHHAGMLPTLKEVVERLFTSRMIKVIFTTETFALGVNMPARSVILDELNKYYGHGFGLLKTRDFYQMAGRAGRRSIDTEAFVYCRVNPHYITPRQLHKVVYSQTERVVSQFNASYATILNLYAKYQEKLYDIYPCSFHYFQERKAGRRRALENLRHKVALLKKLGYIRNKQLTQKGVFGGYVYGYELILTELHASGLLDQLTVKELGVLLLGVVFEPRKGTRRPVLSKSLKRLELFMRDIVLAIHRQERTFKIFPLTKKPAMHLSLAMEAWLNGESFDHILELTSVDEGEVVRYFRMTIQVLRDIHEARISEDLKKKIHQLLKLINRDIIDSEKQLRH